MKRILVVEDNAINLELVTQLLEDDFEVLTAGDGEAALRLADAHRPDLILMDLSLPVMSGWEATQRLRERPELAMTPIVALSAHASPAEIDRALAAGCTAYLTKPIDEDELLKTVATLLAARGNAE